MIITNTGALKSASSPTKCELVKEAASNWDMAKYLWRGNPWNLEVDAVVNSTNEVSTI